MHFLATDWWTIWPHEINELGTITSFLSLIISLYVAYTVHSISKHYKALALIPNVKKRLTGQIKNLLTLKENKDWQGFKDETAAVVANIKFVIELTSGAVKKSAVKCQKCSKKIIDNDSSSFPAADAENFSLSLRTLQMDLENLIQKDKWR